MGRKTRLRKITDDECAFRCAGGVGILREEFWVNAKEEVIRYNLAFLLPHLSRADNGRILGYDNAHGIHERHFMGHAQPVEFHGYLNVFRRFQRKVAALRRGFKEKQ
ncbi:MAG: DUF6516 family protein [Terracidiphilus sp.]|jgi:hypothetical protein